MSPIPAAQVVVQRCLISGWLQKMARNSLPGQEENCRSGVSPSSKDTGTVQRLMLKHLMQAGGFERAM